MYKKTVRRRRAVLAALVALSLILLTAYFGEAPSGGLHAVQRGFLTVISPVESGASTVLSPVRSLARSIGDAFSSGSKRVRLEHQLAKLRARLAAYEAEAHDYRQLAALGRVDTKLSVSRYRPVQASVIGRSPTVWYETVTIDQGTGAGVQDNDPVIDSEGLVGKVSLAAPDGAQVMLISDHEMAVSARLSGGGAFGILKPKVGAPNSLLLEYLPSETVANPGEYVVTAGSVAGQGESLFPPEIPIGEVTSSAASGPYSAVNVRPLVNLHNISTVQVLTEVNGSPPARLTHLVSDPAFGPPTGASAGASGIGGFTTTASAGGAGGG
ncbi:MAG: rod shape-determining protein MreC [Acidobacteriota bacterium]|nr:rod shape-determining protein MreC [Acidobacteriota bacterium]